ncbi:MAG: methylated-DNA--[protein]-cysteine S-methyltransferase [Planctomycetes bacterium]|nr:methylated-DNA--[protein]-cysteine S-methyltransferase [Planctomycetota bacterium]
MNYCIFKTPRGWAGVVTSASGVKMIVLPAENKRKILDKIRRSCPEAEKRITGELRKAAGLVRKYFEGCLKKFDLKIDLAGCSGFEKKVYQALRKIPYGAITTYGKLAENIGMPYAARAVGNAMAKNPLPLVIPCHRVIKSNGSIGRFSALSGVGLKKHLLDLEGSRK